MVDVDKEHNEEVELAAGDDNGGNTCHTSGVVKEAEVTHFIVGKEYNLEEELCDEKVWRGKAEEGRP